MFGRKKTVRRLEYDPLVKEPAIRCSICTGEQVAGFRNRHTGVFEEILALRSEEDLEEFRKMTGVKDIPRFY